MDSVRVLYRTLFQIGKLLLKWQNSIKFESCEDVQVNFWGTTLATLMLLNLLFKKMGIWGCSEEVWKLELSLMECKDFCFLFCGGTSRIKWMLERRTINDLFFFIVFCAVFILFLGVRKYNFMEERIKRFL